MRLLDAAAAFPCLLFPNETRACTNPPFLMNRFPSKTRQIAHMCGVLEPVELMCMDLFDDLPEKYHSISYKAFTRTASVSLDGLGG